VNYRKVIVEIFTELDIHYWEEGKNVSYDSINVRCPFCNDHSNHCGVFVDSMIYHCWLCRGSGPLSKLLSNITDKSPSYCRSLVKQKSGRVEMEKGKAYLQNKVDPHKIPKRSEVEKKPRFPPLCYSPRRCKSNEYLKGWMEERGYGFKTLTYYNCKFCVSGEWGGRLIVPVYVEDEMKGFVGVDVTGEKTIPYKMSDKRVKEFVYGYDDVEDDGDVIIVEGILDKWRLGGNAVATFGTALSEQQISSIVSLKPKGLVICMDGDAFWHSRQKIITYFSAHVEKLKVVRFPEGEDPDSYGRKETRRLIKETSWIH